VKPTPAKFLSDRFKQWRDRHDKGGATLILFLLAILLTALAYLLWGDDPWKNQLLKKFLDGDKLDTRDGITLGLWMAAAINAGIATLLLLTSRWWARLKNHISAPASQNLSTWSRRLFLWGLVGAVLVAVWIRAPRLNHGFWNDEELAFRKFVWAENVVTDTDQLEYKPVSWKYTFFVTISGNNHVTHTVQARAVHQLWKIFFYSEGDRPFSEQAVRLSPFINGLLGIVALALLLRITAYPIAGVTAAWILALNPWHLRYSVEARGYADLLLFIPLTFICLVFALRSGKWRWWIGYGLFQSLYLLSFAGAIYLAVAQNLIVLAVIAKQRNTLHCWRWFVGTAMGAMLFIQIMTPMLIKISLYMKTHTEASFAITVAHLKDLWAHLVFGSQWKSQADPSLHNGMSIEMYQAAHPIIFVLMAFVIPTLVIAGVITLVRKNPELRIFIAALFGALILIGLHNAASDLTFYIWYVVYIVLGFAAALAFVPELIGDGCNKLCKKCQCIPSHYLPVIAAIFLIVAYGWMVSPSIARLRQFEREPMRAAVEFVRGESPALNADNARTLTGAIGSGRDQMRTYDPWMQPIKKQEEFDVLLEKAAQSSLPLFIYTIGPSRVKRNFPEAWEQLENDQLFEKVKYIKGLEEFWSFQIYRLR